MEKQIISYYPTSNSGLIELVDPNVLEKTAGVAEDIIKFLQALEPKKGKSYALINALSGGEYWGSNLNGDWFGEEELEKYHKTFEALGHIYELHKNKDPKKSYGKVIYSFYNPQMHRVELVVEFDNVKAKHILEKLKSGEPIATSMGTRVAYEKCSICGNISKRLSERCVHLKTEMNKIYPDGRKVFAYNFQPKFFDISIVRIPADKTSRIVRMIQIKPSKDDNKKIIVFSKDVDFDEEILYNKVASFETVADINKNIPVKVEASDSAATPKELAKLIKKRLDKDVLYKLSEYPLEDTMSTLLALRIMPAPEDFQKLALLSFGYKDLAEKLDKENIVFDYEVTDKVYVPENLSIDNASEKIAKVLQDEIPFTSNIELWELSRTLTKIASYKEDGTWYPDPIKQEDKSYISRIFTSAEDEPKIKASKNPIVPLGLLGLLYGGYVKYFGKASPNKFKNFMYKNPWIIPVITVAAAFGTEAAQDLSFNKTAGFMDRTFKSGLVSFPLSYYFAGKAEYDARQGKPISGIENFIRKHPTLIGVIGTILGNKFQKQFFKNERKLKELEKLTKTSQLLIKMDKQALSRIQQDLMEAY